MNIYVSHHEPVRHQFSTTYIHYKYILNNPLLSNYYIYSKCFLVIQNVCIQYNNIFPSYIYIYINIYIYIYIYIYTIYMTIATYINCHIINKISNINVYIPYMVLIKR